jgi:hypothetical protein
MVTAVKPKQHSHSFQIENMGKGVARGTCKCGEIREYSGYGREATAEVIQTGDPDFRDSQPAKSPENITEKSLSETGNTVKTITHDRPGNGYGYWEWMDKHKDQILKDYRTMGYNEFLARWHIARSTWKQAQIRWNITGKRPRGNDDASTQPAASITQKSEPSTEKAESSTEKPETVTEKAESSTQKAEPLGNFADTVHHVPPVMPDAGRYEQLARELLQSCYERLRIKGEPTEARPRATSLMGLTLINRLISHWNDDLKTTTGSGYRLAIQQTIDCLEYLKKLEKGE